MKQRRMPTLRLGPITKAVLATVAVAGAVSIFAIAPGLAVAMEPFLRKKKYHSRQVINRNVENLVKRGLLKKVVTKNGDVKVTLTKRGRWEAGIRGFGYKEKNQEKRWDGFWRVIVFDIPENKKHIRHELRRAVVLYGFKQLQKSVWVYPYPCDDFIKLVKTHLGVSSDVLYMKVAYLENDKHLKREFKL